MILFSKSRRETRTAAEALYARTVAAARRPELFLEFSVPDTVEGRFEALTLHLLPVIHRLQRPDGDPEFARVLSEVFVEHMDDALREMGISDRKVPKRMKGLFGLFAGRIDAYSHAIATGDSAALTNAVARNVYVDGDPHFAAGRLATYLKGAVEAFDRTGLQDLRQGSAPFPSIHFQEDQQP
ncbi:cytochrome b pre-mRNA-processing protein 3 [Faunimonas pinastri]|uniref:Cytochrome b pre-mRNA-processing protein 3 n=1 Tax=Faunimonas pinastri TaxID=1855383 RepID=A0A1H9CCI9_9HYPH|nr:ubiquinol-cytochrome C chaperone family protein [Faunimonas pinastri]SEP98852.1 cytochrome b pre-mRNA-processing protein 3 [Faunimonas pinastri]